MKGLRAPRVLHIATHGFFQPNNTPQAPPENPLLCSGLALAGANAGESRGEDGILTALEASNLDLWGTSLVTLSACDTGIGAVRNGEGVYGLRRAFFLAGAETLVMSLWPVSDLVTRDMMTGYYSGLKDGLGRGAALRRIQLRRWATTRTPPSVLLGEFHSGWRMGEPCRPALSVESSPPEIVSPSTA